MLASDLNMMSLLKRFARQLRDRLNQRISLKYYIVDTNITYHVIWSEMTILIYSGQ